MASLSALGDDVRSSIAKIITIAYSFYYQFSVDMTGEVGGTITRERASSPMMPGEEVMPPLRQSMGASSSKPLLEWCANDISEAPTSLARTKVSCSSVYSSVVENGV